VFKALLFLGAGAVIHAVASNDIFAMGGLARRMPQTFVVFLIGTLSLAGIPFFAGFFSKEEILGATWAGGLAIPFAMLVLAAFLTAFYMFRVVFIAFFGPPAAAGAGAPAHGAHGGHDAAHAHDAPAIMTVVLWILALMALGIGIGFARSHPEAEFVAPGWITPLAIGVAVGGIALATVVYPMRWITPEWLARRLAVLDEAARVRFWLDDLFALAYRGGVLGLSRLVGWFDRYIVDGVLNVLSAWTLGAGDRLRRIQSGQAQDYIYGIALGVLLLMVWMRWPR
jgi:NADH-quinone oxidoreductase subunit L